MSEDCCSIKLCWLPARWTVFDSMNPEDKGISVCIKHAGLTFSKDTVYIVVKYKNEGVNMSHEHTHEQDVCLHECLHYCKTCEIVYCCKCGRQWGVTKTTVMMYYPYYPYNTYNTYGPVWWNGATDTPDTVPFSNSDDVDQHACNHNH